MKAADEKVKTSIYLPESLHRKLKETAVALRIKDTEAMEEAVRRWVEDPVPAAKPPLDLPAEDLAVAQKFLKWVRRPRKSRTDEKLVEFVLKEIQGE